MDPSNQVFSYSTSVAPEKGVRQLLIYDHLSCPVLLPPPLPPPSSLLSPFSRPFLLSPIQLSPPFLSLLLLSVSTVYFPFLLSCHISSSLPVSSPPLLIPEFRLLHHHGAFAASSYIQHSGVSPPHFLIILLLLLPSSSFLLLPPLPLPSLLLPSFSSSS